MISLQPEKLDNFTNFSVFSYPRLESWLKAFAKNCEKKKRKQGRRS